MLVEIKVYKSTDIGMKGDDERGFQNSEKVNIVSRKRITGL